MQYQKRRDLTLIDAQNLESPQSLDRDITTDYLVVGGGVAGLHAAQELLKTGKKIVLIEKSICGGGMSGRNGGFLTPDSELGNRQCKNNYGVELAEEIWNFGVEGQNAIVDNVRILDLDVDLRQQDSLLLGRKKRGKKIAQQEYEESLESGSESTLIDKTHLHQYNTGKLYSAGVHYGDCFGINPLQYCQAMKSYLISQGVEIYENTALKKIENHSILTNTVRIDFESVIFALGQVPESLDRTRAKNTFGIQKFLTVSEPLTDSQIQAMFPDGKEYMCWDTKLVFTYYRLIEGKRLLLGGGSSVSSFLPFDVLYDRVIMGVVEEMRANFPVLSHVDFPYYRSGRMQATKDLMPIVDRDKHHPHHVWIQGAVGLPWAASCGKYAVGLLDANKVGEDTLHSVFSSDRKFFIAKSSDNPIVKSVIFSICNAKAMGVI